MKYFFVKIFIDLPRVRVEKGKERVPNAFLLRLPEHVPKSEDCALALQRWERVYCPQQSTGSPAGPRSDAKIFFFPLFPPVFPQLPCCCTHRWLRFAHGLWQHRGGQVPRGAIGKVGPRTCGNGQLAEVAAEGGPRGGLGSAGGGTRGWGPPRAGAAAQQRLAGTLRGFGPELRCKREEEEGARGAGTESIGRGRKRGGEKYIKEREMNNCRQRAKSGLSLSPPTPPFLNLTP